MGALIVGDDEMLNKAMVHRMAARRDASRHQWWMGFPMAFQTNSLEKHGKPIGKSRNTITSLE